MQPGDQYLSEAEALRVHGVARSTYREALRFLEIQGVVKVRIGPGGGPVICHPGWPHLASSVALLLQFANAPMQSVMEARNAIEPGMAEMAAQNAEDDDIAAMEADLAEISETVGNYKRYAVAYRAILEPPGREHPQRAARLPVAGSALDRRQCRLRPERVVPNGDVDTLAGDPRRRGRARRARRPGMPCATWSWSFSIGSPRATPSRCSESSPGRTSRWIARRELPWGQSDVTRKTGRLTPSRSTKTTDTGAPTRRSAASLSMIGGHQSRSLGQLDHRRHVRKTG